MEIDACWLRNLIPFPSKREKRTGDGRQNEFHAFAHHTRSGKARKKKGIALVQTIKIRKESRKRSREKAQGGEAKTKAKTEKGKQDVCDVVNQKLSGRDKAMDGIVGDTETEH